MTVNKDLLRATMDAVLAHPELHDQKVWAKQADCGTAYCFAGWACHLSGLRPNWDFGMAHRGTTSTSWLEDDGGFIPDAASVLLSIDQQAAEWLFASENDVATLKDYVDQLCDAGRITPSDPWTES